MFKSLEKSCSQKRIIRPCETSTIEVFYENSLRLDVVNYFRKKPLS